MPWTETCVMQERVKFIMEVLDGTYGMSELCDYYNISRKTGYKWLGRYQQFGIEALSYRSRAPHNHPNAISPQIQQEIFSIKKEFPKWGAPKIRNRLERTHPDWKHYPAISTIGLFLHKQGLTHSRKRRRKATPTELPLTSGRYNNQVWCVDFKGHFRTGNGKRCNPLTVTDHSTRYLLCCRHLDRMSYELVKMRFERVFAEYGLPLVIRTDNGTPFASRGLGGLSRLSYWWIRLGIYPDHMQIKRVYPHGDIRYFGKRLFVTESLCGEDVGIEQISEDVSRLWYCDYLLGEIDHRKWQIASAKSRPLICAYAQISDYKPEKVLPM